MDNQQEPRWLMLSHVGLFATPWIVAHQAPLSLGFSRQEYWSGSPFLSPGGLPNPGVESTSPAPWVDSLLSEPLGKPPYGVWTAPTPDNGLILT